MIRRLPAIWAWCWCAVAWAQPVPPDAPPVTGAAAAGERVTNGAPVQGPAGLRIGAPAAFGSPELNEDQSAAPAAYIAQLQIDGDVVGDHADLTARVRVEITRGEGWHAVPLAFDQAKIYESSYEDGPGAAAPAVGPDDADGLRWLFRGVGTHRLLIRFRLPIGAVAAGRQLQLSLPRLPANYVTRAVLRIPDAHVLTAEPLTNTTLQQQVLESGVTELSCDVEGSRWELSWRTAVDAAPRLARVVTGVRVRADREARLLRLTARQQCTVEQGRIGDVLARLPTGFDLESVELRGATAQSLTTTEDSGRAGWVRVQLGDAAQGVFELEWRLTRVFPAGGGSIVVDGLELEGARWQGGTIEVETVEGYGVRYQAAESVALQRVDVAERRPGEPAFDFRFEFQRQPFVLAYELSPVAARTDAVADAFLSISVGSHDLYLDVRLEVLSGQVHEIAIDWPGFVSAGWRPGFARAYVTVESGGAAEEVVDGTLDQDALSADPDRLRLQLSRPCAGSLRTLLHFARVAPPQSGTLDLSLPRPAATFVRAASLTVASAVNLETSVATAGDELPRVPREGALPAGVPLQFAGDGARVYALLPEPPPVSVAWTERRRTIAAETTVTAELLNPGAVRVVQDIAYDVTYGYVSTLLLESPPEWRGGAADGYGSAEGSGMRVVLDGQELPAESRDGHWRVEPPDPRRGRFQLTIEHVVPAPAGSGDSEQTVAIPILQAVDAPFGSTTVHLPGARKLRLADSEAGWQSWLTRSGDGAWRSATPRQGVQLLIEDTLRNAPQQFLVDTAFVRTWFGDPGQVSVYAEYAIREAPASVVLTLPESASAVEYLWNGAAADVRGDVDAGPGEQVIVLPVGDQETIEGRLSVRYRLRRADRAELVSTCAVEFPRFGDKVEVDTTYWEVVLPPGEQLSTPPSGFVPQYEWERESVLWARRPTAEYRAIRERLAVHEQDVAGAARGNVYPYSAVGAAPRGACRAMALSLIVLIGAGVSLLLGFLFRRVPATRNLLSILVLGFACALGALWQLELIQLLLQPALLGLSLAAIAAWFDSGRQGGRGRRSQTSLSGGRSSDRRSTAVPLSPALPARTAVFQPEAASESGRPG